MGWASRNPSTSWAGPRVGAWAACVLCNPVLSLPPLRQRGQRCTAQAAAPPPYRHPRCAGGDIALLLAALHGPRVGRVLGIGAMAGSKNTVLPDLPDIFNPATFGNLSQGEQVGWLGLSHRVPCWTDASLRRKGCSCPALLSLQGGEH